MNVVLIGAHPDDCELNAGGTIVKWIEAGFDVCVVSMTNGDIGHHEQAGGTLARRRLAESHEAARRSGADSIVLDNHDGELQPTLDVRRQIVSILREREADLVVTHRPNDYHPDHRYTSQVVQDAAYMVTVPYFVPHLTSLRANPVFMYFMDKFEKPIPFAPDVAVAIDDVVAQKWRILDAMESQVYEWLPWHAGRLDEVPDKPETRLAWLEAFWAPWFEAYTEKGRAALHQCYGGKAASVRFAELYEVCEYGRRPTVDDLQALFPFVPQLAGKHPT